MKTAARLSVAVLLFVGAGHLSVEPARAVPFRQGVGSSGSTSSAPEPAPTTTPAHHEHHPRPLHVHGRLTEKHIIGFLRDPSGAAAAACSLADADAPKSGWLAIELPNHDSLVSHRFLLNLDGKDVEVSCPLSGDACKDAGNVYEARFTFDPQGNLDGGGQDAVRGVITVSRDGRRDSRSFAGTCRSRPPSSIP